MSEAGSQRSTAQRHAFAFLAGASLIFAFPEPDLGFLAWFALAPLIVMLRRAGTAGRGASLGWLFGLGFFGAVLHWISLVGYVAWILLVLLQSLFALIFGALYAPAARRLRVWTRVLLAPALWVAVEFARSAVPLGGFPWGQLSQTQHDLGWMLKPAAFGGGWIVTFIVVAVNALLAEAWEARSTERPRAVASLGIAAALIALPAVLPTAEDGSETLRVAIVQGNVPRDIPRGAERDLAIVESHVRLTQELADEDIDVAVWPESSVGIDPERFPEVGLRLADAARELGAPLIVGATLDAGEEGERYLVVALLVSPEGEIVDRYQKTHLVPFGEYVPGRSALDWLPLLDQIPRDAVPGDEHAVFEVDGSMIAPVISFEGDFGSLVREPVSDGGRIVVVATNTSTWGETWASAQHVAFSQLRAVENGVWVVHGALSGISAFVAPDGTVEARTSLWTETTLVRDVPVANDVSFYARTGDWFPIASALMALGLLVGARRGMGTVPA